MRRALAILITVLTISGLTAAGYAAEYDRYDRYERGYRVEPPPPPPPAPRRAAEVPPPRHSTYSAPYFFAHLGVYSPNDDSDGLFDYDAGGSFDFGLGSRLSPIFAVEGTFGGFSAERGEDDVTVVPLTLGARLIIPNPVVEPYLGGGFGLYFSSLDEPSSGIDDDSTDFGGYLSLGMDFWLTPRVAVNFEGKYHWIDAEYEGIDVDLSGWIASLGVRVSF